MKPTKMALVAAVTLAAATAWALDLTTAKSNGFVGEQANGYLGIVQGASGDVQALVEDVNAKRRARYQALAEQHGIPLEVVEGRAGQKAIQKTQPGNYVMESGAWRKK